MATDREIQLLHHAAKSGITSAKEIANFMAQVSVESNGLTHLEEGFRYAQNNAQIPVKYAHREGEQVLDAARLEALHGKPEKLAELIYGGRMGNDQPGDGYTYRGRGYMQLTGKENYAKAGKALGLDLLKHPELAAEPEHASKIAIWYWEDRVPKAAHEDVKKATLAINGGYNGLAAREAEFAKWEKTLTPEVMQYLGKGEAAQWSTTQFAPHFSQPVTALEQGIRDAAFDDLHANLAKLGHKDRHSQPLKPDGYFGFDTSYAVERLQHDHRLTVTGVADKKTLHVLHQAQSKQAVSTHQAHDAGTFSQPASHASPALAVQGTYLPLATPHPLEPGDRGAAVQVMQQHLQAIGATDRDGNALQDDRHYGPRTQQAVENFQRWAGREVTGIADPGTLDALRTHAQFATQQNAHPLATDRHVADNNDT